MSDKEKLVELLGNIYLPMMCGPDTIGEYRIPHKFKKEIASHLIARGVTVQEWISVKDRLPEMRDDGFADAFLVTDGTLAHIAYFVDGDWIFTDNGQMKEPMFYDVTHWHCLPQPPKGE